MIFGLICQSIPVQNRCFASNWVNVGKEIRLHSSHIIAWLVNQDIQSFLTCSITQTGSGCWSDMGGLSHLKSSLTTIWRLSINALRTEVNIWIPSLTHVKFYDMHLRTYWETFIPLKLCWLGFLVFCGAKERCKNWANKRTFFTTECVL